MLRKPNFAALAAGFVLALGILPVGEALARKAPANIWPQAASNIPADPNVRFGTLPNGMRYAIQRNATPPGQASLRLRFDAGSLMETDAQQGIAHFLEHMAFNGSQHVPEGDMVKILERHGLAFGADTNAQTSWSETVYQLDLPHTDDDTVDTSLMLLREAASELTIANDAVGRERGVVLSEERARDTPGLRVFKSGMGFFLKDQLAARRLPIGKVDVIQNADHDLINGFYRKYYRPERAVLVVVGDFDPDAMEAKIKARFSGWSDPAPAGAEPVLGKPAKRGLETRLLVEPGAPLSIQVYWEAPADTTADTAAKRQRRLTEQLGLAVFNRRLERLARSPDAPFIGAGSYKTDILHSAEATVLTLSAKPGDWRPALIAADQEQRRLVHYGVRQDELDREIKEMRVQYQAAAAAAATRKTPQIADDIAGTLDDRVVYTSPAEDLALFEAEVKTIDAKTVSRQIGKMFSGSGPLVFMASPEPVAGGEATLSQAYAQSRAAPVQAEAAGQAITWPYASFGAPGKVASKQDIADLETSFVTFGNGVRLTVKPTKFRDNQVLVRVRIGHGLLDLPRDQVTTAWAARGAFIEGGLKAISDEDMERVLASNIYGADFSAADDAFVLQGVTRPEDLDIQLQVLAAYASAPGFRPEAFARMRTYGATLNDQMDATASGVMSRDLSRLMHGGDPRFGFPNRQEIADAKPDAFRALLEPRIESGPVEVIIVGDISVDKAIAMTAATFGALPARTSQPAPAAGGVVSLPQAAAQPVTLTHKGRADQAIAYAEWPTDDFFASPQQARTLRVLAEIVELRLLDDLREAAGVTYSPQASTNASLTFPHYGYVAATVEIPPGKIDDFYRDLAKISADLRTKEVDADELERAKKPLVDALEKSRETNEYWLEQLSGAQDEPRKLDAVRTVVASLTSVSPADLKAAAQLYLRDDKLWKLQVTPAAK